MFRHYPPEARVWAIEPDAEFLALTRPPANVRMIRASGLELPFPDGRFDVVVIALVLCTVPSVERTLLEIRRVLKPDGELRLIEHVRSARSGGLMDALNPLWLRLNGQGCNRNHDPIDALRRTGFNIAQLTCFVLFPFPARIIRARA